MHSTAYSIIPLIFNSNFSIKKKFISDETDKLAQFGAKCLGCEKWTGQWEEVVRNKEVDVVNICTPNNIHMPIAIAAAENRKHVFM